MAEGPDPAAPYQALYRRYRPQRFADVLGQEHVTRALTGAVRDGKVAHAYLFSGPRGTGKTSTARILAMALNCENPQDGEPDGTCPSCVAIRQGSSLDVQELDSATNRGIDEMKDLLSRVALGTPGRWKVYIVDEVHQLTPAAASALLKTLEEPPGHVIFVLATTDAQKVLPTIRSRTQHFEFRLLGPEVLASLLRDVNEWAALGLPPEAIDLVVRRGHGSARDALSVLDQVAAAGDVDDEATVVSDLVDAIADRDPGRVLVEVAEAITAGRDPRRIGTEVVDHLRNGFLATQARSLVMLADDAAAVVEAQARRLGPGTLVRAMEVVGQALIDMRDAVDPRITLEVALVRLASPEADDTRSALIERIERLERALESGAAGGPRSAPGLGAGGAGGGAAAGPTGGAAGPGTAAATRPAASGAGPAGPVGPAEASRASAGAAPAPPLSDPPPLPGGPGRAALGALRGPRPQPPPPTVPAPTGSAAEPAEPGESRPVDVPQTKPDAGPDPSAARPLPSREELTLAWGDSVLGRLPSTVKPYLSSGRFLGVDGSAAIYGVRDAGLLARAQLVRSEAEAALARHFGRPVPMRLVLDDGSRPSSDPVSERPQPVADDDPADFDLSELEDAPSGVASPEQRLLEAFPGAEEVLP